MLTRVVRSLALIFYALSMGLSFAHALEMPVKMRYDGPLYVTVQNSLYLCGVLPARRLLLNQPRFSLRRYLSFSHGSGVLPFS